MKNMLGAAALAAAVAFSVLLPAQVPGPPFDVLITGGRVYDGTGNPPALADVGIRAGRIAAVGRLRGASARRTIDARGKVVMPGFVDPHSHADGGLGSDDRRRRAAPNLITQGITTVVVNPDGRGPWPLSEQKARYEKLGIGPNAALMVGHNTVRARVMGEDYRRAAHPDEIRQMKELVRQGMEQEAFGLTAGLEYVPGIWSTTEEVVELVREIVPFAGTYIVHQRSESTDPRWFRPSFDPPGPPTMLDAVAETIEIGEKTGATVVWSHCKVQGAHYWGSGQAAIQLIEAARARGVDVWTDQYPYNTSSGDGSAVLVPAWATGANAFGGRRGQTQKVDYAGNLRRTMDDPVKAENVRKDVRHEINRRGGPENVRVMDHPDKTFVGKTLLELSTARGISPVEMALQFQYEGYRDRPGGARVRGFAASELDIEALMRQLWTASSTDAGVSLPEDGPDVHARAYGSYPRRFRRYVLERRTITLEHAVRASTSLPAQILGFRDRGLLREGLVADVVVMDLDRVRDLATFEDPHQFSEGIDYVLVNGTLVVDAGKITGELPGKVLTRATVGRP
jgi:N-acyl-D-amino-acid deacylase